MSLALPCILLLLCAGARAQVNSGSTGADGAFNPTTNTVINMADHPDGIYHYTSVNIPVSVTVTFIPNANNTPVVWLVQNNCAIDGTVSVQGASPTNSFGAPGGPGGYRGGNGILGAGVTRPQPGFGPGGGQVTTNSGYRPGNGSYGTKGDVKAGYQDPSGETYGNQFIVPLIGGSGGSGGHVDSYFGGAGGGGAILIAVSGQLSVSGSIKASGGNSYYNNGSYTYIGGGGGSGGAIRAVTTSLIGSGNLLCDGGNAVTMAGGPYVAPDIDYAGVGRVRIDALSDAFNGYINAVASRGFQPIILPPANLGVSLSIQSVAGIAVAASPTGAPTTPDVLIPSQQANPIPIVVRCANIPLNTEVIVEVKPASGATVRASAFNNTGTLASSTATVPVNMPRGGGLIQAKAISGITGSLTAQSVNPGGQSSSLSKSGWTASGERFSAVEVIAAPGAAAQKTFITESGKRYPAPAK